jgi:hypothetical protein
VRLPVPATSTTMRQEPRSESRRAIVFDATFQISPNARAMLPESDGRAMRA